MSAVQHMVKRMLFSLRRRMPESTLNWKSIGSVDALNEAIAQTLMGSSPTLALFKHSTRCGISRMAKRKLESEWAWDLNQVIPAYIDVLAARHVSDAIEKWSGITHESPQLIVVKKGQILAHGSHHEVEVDLIGM